MALAGTVASHARPRVSSFAHAKAIAGTVANVATSAKTVVISAELLFKARQRFSDTCPEHLFANFMFCHENRSQSVAYNPSEGAATTVKLSRIMLGTSRFSIEDALTIPTPMVAEMHPRLRSAFGNRDFWNHTPLSRSHSRCAARRTTRGQHREGPLPCPFLGRDRTPNNGLARVTRAGIIGTISSPMWTPASSASNEAASAPLIGPSLSYAVVESIANTGLRSRKHAASTFFCLFCTNTRTASRPQSPQRWRNVAGSALGMGYCRQ